MYVYGYGFRGFFGLLYLVGVYCIVLWYCIVNFLKAVAGRSVNSRSRQPIYTKFERVKYNAILYLFT